MVNQQAVARAAGVSAAVVSAFFTGNYYARDHRSAIGISKKTRDKIKSACKRLNFRPENPAMLFELYPEQADIAFLLNETIPDGYASPYHAMILNGVTQHAFKNKVNVLNFYFNPDHDYLVDPDPLPPAILNNGIRKILICGGRQNYSLFLKIQELGGCSVLLGQSIDIPGVVSVAPDFREAARSAIHQFHQNGHVDIFAVVESFHGRGSYPGREMKMGALEAMLELGLSDCENRFLQIGDTRATRLYPIVDRLMAMKPRPTAVYCMTDWTAQLLVVALQDRGAVVPDDISVIGTDDDRFATGLRPPLSTFHIPQKEIGEIGFESVQRISVNGVPKGPEKIVLPVRYVKRGSVKGL